jgi:hypothetical protein
MIEIELLEKYDAVRKRYKSQIILRKDHLATQYYQVISGSRKNE